MTMPTFLVIGAAKAGTTSLRHYLTQHPEIYMAARGEPSFFAHADNSQKFYGPGDNEWTFVTAREDYERLFTPGAAYRARGEISPRYLYFEKAAARIRAHVPDVRLIAILRHPVDRAYSHFLMNRGRDCEPITDFALALEQEAHRLNRGWGWDWCYVGAGLYHQQLSRYIERFPRQHIKVFFYEEYRNDECRFFADLFSFIGVDNSFRPDTRARARKANLPRNYQLYRALERRGGLKSLLASLLPGDLKHAAKRGLHRLNATRPPPLDLELRQTLFDKHFRADAERLAVLIHQTPDWLA